MTFTPQYMVWVKGTKAPAFRYESLESAMQEAERLCQKEGKPAYVLQDILVAFTTSQPVAWVAATKLQTNQPDPW